MGTYAANLIETWFAGYDLTGDLNQVQLGIEYEPLDSTAFRAVARSRKAGLESVASTVNGFADFADDAVDEQAIAMLTGTPQPLTQSVDGQENSVAYFFQARHFSYQVFGEVGNLVPFTLAAQNAKGNGLASVGAVRGRVAKAKGNVSATGAIGTGQQLGAVGAGQYLYADLHVFSAGTTITVVLESDDNSGFTSATTRATLGPITTVGGTWATRAAGAITDTYYRFRVTAITGTFSVAGAIGIK